MKYCCTSPIMRMRELGGEDAGVLRLILFEDVRLHRAAHLRQRFGLDAVSVHLGRDQLIAGHAEQREPEPSWPSGSSPL